MSHPGHKDMVCRTCHRRVGGCRCFSKDKPQEPVLCPWGGPEKCEHPDRDPPPELPPAA